MIPKKCIMYICIPLLVEEVFKSFRFLSSAQSRVYRRTEDSPGGAVEIEEFLLGCLRLRGSARAMDIASWQRTRVSVLIRGFLGG